MGRLTVKYTDIRKTIQRKPFFPNMLNNEMVEIMLKEDVDKYVAELCEKLDVLRWRPCVNNVPQENYFVCNYDWVLVKVKESDTGWEIPMPQIAEYNKNQNKWHFQDESCKEYHDSLIVLCWRPIEKVLK